MVSRAFNPEASVRGELRRDILAKAAEVGYAPDKTARAMATGRTDLVALVVPTLAHPWESQEVDLICQSLQEMALTPVIYRIPNHMADYASLIRVQDYRPALVIAFMDKIMPGTLLPLFGSSPAIYPYFGEEPPEAAGQTVDFLKVEQHEGIRHAIRLFRAAGHREVLYVGGTDYANSDVDRDAAVRAAIGEEGLAFAGRIEGDFDYDTARSAVNGYLTAGGSATAFFAANDVSAFGTLDALRFDQGRRVPEEAAVIGFDNVAQSNWRAYDLTTVSIPLGTRVAAITRMIGARLRNPAIPQQRETVTARLVVRSTA